MTQETRQVRRAAVIGTLCGALIAGPALLVAGNVTGLTTFTNGAVADAVTMNANFAAVTTAVNDNNGRLAAIENAATSFVYEVGCNWRTTNTGSSAPPAAGSCTPAACVSGHTSLGTYTTSDVVLINYDPWSSWFGTAMGRTIRNCHVPAAVGGVRYETKCGWNWSTYNGDTQNINSCTPPACGAGHVDLGTNNIATTGSTYTQYNQSHDISSVTGHVVRTCMIPR